MGHNGFTPTYTEGYADVEDQRWRKNSHGINFSGQNITLVVDEGAKAEGDHRIGRWLKSGVPIYRDADGKAHVFTAEAKAEGAKVAGLLQSALEIMDRDGVWYDTRSMVGIQTAGEIYPAWLPVSLEPEDIPTLFNTSPL